MDPFRRRARSLAEVDGASEVRLVGRVHAADGRVSPFTGRRGAVFGWTFWVNRRRETVPSTLAVIEDALDRTGPSPFGAPSLELVGDVTWSDGVAIVIEGRNVALPALGVDVAFAAGGDEPRPLDVAWPTWLPAPAALDRGAAYFVERVLLDGDEVELVATIEAVTKPLETYRERGSENDFVVRQDREKPRLVERDDPTSIG